MATLAKSRKAKKLKPTDHMSDKKLIPAGSQPNPDLMKLADDIRSAANCMTDSERAETLEYGMQLIYGGNSDAKAKVSRP